MCLFALFVVSAASYYGIKRQGQIEYYEGDRMVSQQKTYDPQTNEVIKIEYVDIKEMD